MCFPLVFKWIGLQVFFFFTQAQRAFTFQVFFSLIMHSNFKTARDSCGLVYITTYIPSNIGQMKMLESLDLSRNSLFGEIPASFSNLTFLSYLNLSFNNLSGKIPTVTQLQTFDASTSMGNQGLCGPPLTKECPGDESSPNPQLTHTNDSEEYGDELINFGFYGSMGFGFIIGFWGVCGSLIVKTSWRQAYFQFMPNINDWIYIQAVLFITRMKGRFQHS